MEKPKIHLKISTPQEIKVDQLADMVIFRCINGDMGILPGHEPAAAVLDDGILRIINGKTQQQVAVFGGIAEVQNNEVNILTSSAEWPEDIDQARAKHDYEQAELLLRERSDDLKMRGYQVLLRRALVRIEVSTSPGLDDQIDNSDDDDD